MEVKETKIDRTPREVTITKGIRCDLCKKISEDRDGWNTGKNTYKIFTCHFESELREGWPEYHSVEGVKADFCPECTVKVIQALVTLGVEIENYEFES